MSLLKLINVSKIYKMDSISFSALKNVNLEIKKGEFVSIVGPSGSGKSTLMHIMGCLDRPTEGKVILNKQNVLTLSEAKLAQIRNKEVGFVFQMFNLLPRTTALDNVLLPLTYQKTKEKKRQELAKMALTAVGLEKRLYYLPSQLSGGEQQRVAIARALVTSPAIILADEPTGNIDTKTGKNIMELLKKLNKEGNTIVVVTHDPKIAQYAKRQIKIIDGEIQ